MILEAITREMRLAGENPNKLAKALKMKHTQMYKYFNGENKPGLDIIEKMCTRYDLVLIKKEEK